MLRRFIIVFRLGRWRAPVAEGDGRHPAKGCRRYCARTQAVGHEDSKRGIGRSASDVERSSDWWAAAVLRCVGLQLGAAARLREAKGVTGTGRWPPASEEISGGVGRVSFKNAGFRLLKLYGVDDEASTPAAHHGPRATRGLVHTSATFSPLVQIPDSSRRPNNPHHEASSGDVADEAYAGRHQRATPTRKRGARRRVDPRMARKMVLNGRTGRGWAVLDEAVGAPDRGPRCSETARGADRGAISDVRRWRFKRRARGRRRSVLNLRCEQECPKSSTSALTNAST